MLFRSQVLVEAVDAHQCDGAQDLDALVGDPALEKFSLHLTCANLFDRHYDKKSGSFYDPRPGRYMEAGLTYRF